MQTVIWKYDVPLTGKFSCQMPNNAIFLAVEPQASQGVKMWWQVDPSAERFERTFEVHGTGEPFHAEGRSYLGTFQTPNSISTFVWHLFAVKR